MATLLKPSEIKQDFIEIPSKSDDCDNSFFSMVPFYWFSKKYKKNKSGKVQYVVGRITYSNCIIQFDPDELENVTDISGYSYIKKITLPFTINDKNYVYHGILPLKLVESPYTYECLVDLISRL